MGKITDKLDMEIEALEQAAGFTKSVEGNQGDGAADPSSFTIDVSESVPSPASELVQDPSEVATVTPESTSIVEEPTPPDGELKKSKRVSWKSRYTKLKAHHDSSRFKDRQTINQAFEKIAQLERDNSGYRQKLEEFQAKERSVSATSLVTDEERDIIGDEGISSIDKLTQRAVDAAVAPLKEQLKVAESDRIASQEARAADAKASAEKIFRDQLGQLVPDYATIDQDPEFEQYLRAPDPLTGQTRFDFFSIAHKSGDVGRVADFFKAFKATKGAPPRQTLEAKVTPVGQNGTPQNPVGQGEAPKFYSIAQYNKFMDGLTKGEYVGKQAEADAIEAEFDRAFMEGRIR